MLCVCVCVCVCLSLSHTHNHFVYLLLLFLRQVFPLQEFGHRPGIVSGSRGLFEVLNPDGSAIRGGDDEEDEDEREGEEKTKGTDDNDNDNGNDNPSDIPDMEASDAASASSRPCKLNSMLAKASHILGLYKAVRDSL